MHAIQQYNAEKSSGEKIQITTLSEAAGAYVAVEADVIQLLESIASHAHQAFDRTKHEDDIRLTNDILADHERTAPRRARSSTGPANFSMR